VLRKRALLVIDVQNEDFTGMLPIRIRSGIWESDQPMGTRGAVIENGNAEELGLVGEIAVDRRDGKTMTAVGAISSRRSFGVRKRGR